MSRFSETSSVGELLDMMMVERWNRTVIYGNYYDGCSPKECVYTVEKRNDLIHIVTTVIGLVGGLSTILKMILPHLVRIIRRQNTARKKDKGKTWFARFLSILLSSPSIVRWNTHTHVIGFRHISSFVKRDLEESVRVSEGEELDPRSSTPEAVTEITSACDQPWQTDISRHDIKRR